MIDVIKRRREVASIYEDRLESIDELQLPAGPKDDGDNFDTYQNYELQADKRERTSKIIKREWHWHIHSMGWNGNSSI